jgi:hypothetical protein
VQPPGAIAAADAPPPAATPEAVSVPSAAPPPPAPEMSAVGLLWRAFKFWLQGLFRGRNR